MYTALGVVVTIIWIVIAFLWLILAIAAAIVADSKGRSAIGWLGLGLIFPFAILFVSIAPAKEVAARENSPKQVSKFDGQASLDNDVYKMHLVDKYGVRKHEVLGQFVLKDKLYATIDDALRAAETIDASTIVVKEGLIPGVRKRSRRIKFREFKDGSIELDTKPGNPAGRMRFQSFQEAEQYVGQKY